MKLINAIVTLTILILMAIFVASLKHHKLFQKILALIGLRFLVLYFQALGSLALTGVGLIFSGVVIIAAVYFWNKHRRTLEQWAERIAQ